MRMLDETIELTDNAMLKIKPELYNEWNFQRNDDLKLYIYDATKGQGVKAWWNCLKCESSYDMSIANKSSGVGCPYCSGRRVNHTNSLASLNPKLAKEWHPTKNGELTPHDVTCRRADKIWWLGECGHEWDSVISSRSGSGKVGCPYCSNLKLLTGFNDMWTTNPELAKILANPEDGYEHSIGQHVKLDWICPSCTTTIKNKYPYNVKKGKLGCPVCSDGKSFGEKVIYYFLTGLNINFDMEKTFKWSLGKRYDYYLKDYQTIIEIHGNQHRGKGFEDLDGMSLEEVIKNDTLKETIANKNGIKNYITIDYDNNKRDDFKYSIENSMLSDLIDLQPIDWNIIYERSLTSMATVIWDEWNKGNRSVNGIISTTKLSRTSVTNYLKLGAELGKCDYDRRHRFKKEDGRTVIQLDENLQFIKKWNSVKKASESLNLKSSSSIVNSCTGHSVFAGGFRWLYEDDYEKFTKGELEIKVIQPNARKMKKVYQLDKYSLEVINIWNSCNEAAEKLELNLNSIRSCCISKNSLKNYLWIYEADYINMT